MSDHHLPLKSIYAALGASLTMAAMGAAIKAAAPLTNNEMVVFLRNGFGLLCLLPVLLRDGPRVFATQRFGAHMARSIAGLAAMYCFFYAIARLHLAEAVLLNFSSPVFTAVIAHWWLKEALTGKVAMAVVTGLIGIALILKPGVALLSPAAVVGVASAVLAALAMVNLRSMSDTEPTHRIVLYFSTTSTVLSAIPLAWAWQPPAPAVIGYMAAAGLFATLGQFMLTYSYTTAPAAKVGTLNYTTVVFAALVGWWFWGETPDWLSVAGAVLICYAGVLVAKRPPAEAD